MVTTMGVMNTDDVDIFNGLHSVLVCQNGLYMYVDTKYDPNPFTSVRKPRNLRKIVLFGDIIIS